MRRGNFAIPVKLWALACTIIGISLTADTVLTCVLTVTGFAYLGAQRNWRLLRSMAVFYALLGILLYLIRFHDFHPAVFSEFYVHHEVRAAECLALHAQPGIDRADPACPPPGGIL